MLRKTLRKIRAIPHRGKEPYLSFYKILGFYPDRINLYREAVTHRSSSIRSERGRWINNERLEFLGDAILDAIVADILYKKFEQKKEGFLTSMRSRIVQRDTLNKLAVELGLDKIIVSSTRNLAHNTNIYGDALEALIGAIYLDQGYRVAKNFVYETLIRQHIDMESVIKNEVDFKSRLIEWGQKNKVDVIFDIVDSSYDTQNNPIFQSKVYVCGVETGSGDGFSKKESHQKAAKKALKKLKGDDEFQKQILALAKTGANSNLDAGCQPTDGSVVADDVFAEADETEFTPLENKPAEE